MNQEELTSIELSLEEYENFKSVADKFNIPYDVNHKRDDLYTVEAPLSKFIEWGYLDEESKPV